MVKFFSNPWKPNDFEGAKKIPDEGGRMAAG